MRYTSFVLIYLRERVNYNFASHDVYLTRIIVLIRFQREQLAVHWREWMTDRTLQLYNSNRVYYALERDIAGSAESSDSKKDANNGEADISPSDETEKAAPPARIDNPDQRITEDVS